MANGTNTGAAKTKAGSGGRITKKDQLIKLLGTKSGSDITSLSTKLGWQQHTTRAALSGLRKAGYEVVNEKPANGGVSKYRILSQPTLPRQAPTAGTSHGA